MKKYAFALAACLVFVVSQAQLKPVGYTDAAQKLNGVAAIPSKSLKNKPGILILPAWKGIDNHARESATALAALGYYAFVADIYGEGNYPANTEEAGKRSGYYKKHYDQYQHRIQLALDQLVKSGANPDKIVVIGYCFGGTGALEAVRGQLAVKGAVSFHGGLGRDTARPITPFTAKVLVCHGADDPFVPEQDIVELRKEFKAAYADWQMVYYADAVHSFTDPDAGNNLKSGAAYNDNAAKRSWQHLLVFLKEVL
jgi:dienelactone hydrolase